MKPIALFEIANAVFVAVALLGYLDNKDKTKAAKVLRITLTLSMVHLVIDALAYTLVGAAYPFALRYAVNFLAYTMSGIDMFAFIMYCSLFISSKAKLSKTLFRIPLIVSGLCTLACAVLFIAGKLVVYENGTAVAVNDIPLWVRFTEFAVMLYTPIVTFRFRKKIGWKAALLMVIYCIAPIFTGVAAIFIGVDFSVVVGAVSVLLVASVVQTEEYRKRLLGAMPLSNTVLSKANIGMWAFELDEGQPPRMYDDETMLGLVGLEKQVSPEETYHAWYDHIDAGSYDLVNDAVAKMMAGEHAEVQYPWHYPDGRTIIVRCGGVRNFKYTKGIRIEGTHQDVTEMLHFDEDERKRYREQEITLVKLQFRADALRFVVDNDPNIDTFMDFFGNRLIEISHCDQVILRTLDGQSVIRNAAGTDYVPGDICAKCPFSDIRGEVYGDDGTVIMNDCRKGCRGVSVHPDCPAKSSFMQQIVIGGRLAGLLTVHYLRDYHTFTEEETDIVKAVATYLGLFLARQDAKKSEEEKIEAEASSKAKTEFLFNMSHDIRTPMNAIIGFTDKAIKNRNDPKVLEESLGKVKSSSEYMLSIVNDILDMAKIESGKLEIIPTLHFGEKGKNTLIEVFGAEAARKGIEFFAEYDIKDRYFWVDENRINQIVANLISNSIKYTEPGGEIRYSVKQLPCEREGYGRYCVTVEDTGCGMSKEFLSKIFDAFERDKSAIRSGEQGTGLGMAIVKKLVDAVGASIEIESEPGKGTKVTFISENRLATEEEIASYSAPSAPEGEAAADFTGKKVLIVEDNELNREIATDILEDEGLVIEEAEDGTVAVEMMKEKGPDYYDFILMDIQMPIMNGYEATKAIREMYPDASLPIIALSANAFEEDRQKSIDAGMNGHVAKPINIKELFDTLTKFL